MFFGCRIRLSYASLVPVITLTGALAACAEKAHELSFDVSFACAEDRELADALTLRVVREGCTGTDAVYEVSLVKGAEAPLANGIAAGEYGLEAQAWSEGALLASECVAISLPQPSERENPAIVLRSEACIPPPIERDAGDPQDGASDPAMDAAAATGGSDAANADAAPRICASDCSDPFPCTEDRCVDGECVHEPYSGMRECDGVMCTEGDTCEQGTCQPGTPNNAACPDDGNPCTAETCEVGTGCNRDNAEGAPCNDQIGCTNLDRCQASICRGADSCTGGAVCSAASGMCIACTSAADCDDRDPCTTDTCSAGTCTNVANTGSCNDGKACTTNDVCNNRVCAGTSTCPADATCGGSTCRCNDTSETLCSNSCVNLTNSAQHCGQCGRACANGGTCQNSACKPSAASSCTAYRHGGHDYLICPDALTWTSARERCRSYQMGLAIIEGQAENDFLRTRPNAATRWFGANDRGNNGDHCTLAAEEGTWYWASPNDTSSDNFKRFCAFANRDANGCTVVEGGYQNWQSNQPDNDGCDRCWFNDCPDGEDCGVFNADGTWNDQHCGNSVGGFICETP